MTGKSEQMSSRRAFPLVLACLLATGWAEGAELRLADKGQARCVVVTPANWQAPLELPAGLPPAAVQRLEGRQKLAQESVKDLALYLGKMSGTEVLVVEGAPPAGDPRVPVYIGAAAEAVFGPVGISKEGLFGFRVVVEAKRGIGLYGESDVGTSYAIYELLHRLGCRWYMPSKLGEVVPSLPALPVPEMDLKLAPATSTRNKWQGGSDFKRRNRLGEHGNDIYLSRGDGSFERFFNEEDLKANPEWRALKADGKPHPWALRPTHPAVADHVANKILAQLDTIYAPMRKMGLKPTYQITPGDGQVPTEDPMERPHDPEPRIWEPAAGRWSVTDRCMVLHNRIATKVRAKYPEVTFADYAYVNKSLPPAKQKVPDDFLIVLAPIDFNRHHPMTWEGHINEFWLRDMVEGWGKTGAGLGAYWYGINLAEVSAPCPFITKWGTDIAILLENNLRDWTPETMNGWDSMLPGYYLAVRMTFHKHEKPAEILADLWTRFYGAAAEPMSRYWLGIDQAYLDARQYAGSPFGYLRIFTPEVMTAARGHLNDALAACRTVPEYQRVKLIDESFTLFELYMKMRNDWAAGNLRGIEGDYDTWRWGVLDMVRRYRDPADSTYVQGRHGNPRWSDSMYSVGYRAGAKMEREYLRHGKPMLEWKWQHNPGLEAEALPWTAPEFNDKAWPVTHVVRDTWSSLGHHLTMTDDASGRSGRLAYRATQRLAALPAGKKALLWIGATDGSVKVFVNGQQIKYVNAKGETLEAFSGYCQAASFDITAALKTGDNQFTILADRHNLNELGTGGLLGPVVLYREK